MLQWSNHTVVWSEILDINQTDPGAEGDSAGPEAVIVPIIFGLIFLLGVAGNILVMVVIGKFKSGTRARSTTNIFILNLSIADLSFLLFCVPFHATIYSLPEWIFGALLCKFAHYFAMVSMLVSIFTLVATSVDRYIAVVLSKKSPSIRSRRNALVGVCVIWALSLIFAVPVAQHHVLTNHPAAPNSTFCWEKWSGPSKQIYKVTILIIGYLLPLVLIICCYSKVLFHLHKKLKKMSKKSERSKRKTAQTVLLVVTAFLICWMPYHIIAMWVEFGNFPLNDASFAFRIMAHILSYGNSCINPILYAFHSENFRKACRQVCGCHLYPPPPTEKMARRMDRMESTTSTIRSTTAI